MANQPDHLRPWSRVDDEELRLLRELADGLLDLAGQPMNSFRVQQGLMHLLGVADRARGLRSK